MSSALVRDWRVLALVLLVGQLSAPGPLRAWGAEGHRIIATLAERSLSDAARRQAEALLGGESLAAVSSWADDYRRRCVNTGPWHYVNVPLEATRYEPKRDCAADRGCVLSALARESAILRDHSQSAADRGRALRWVVHLVADLHQPLHVGDRHDRGGNDMWVNFLGRPTNFHRVWDVDLIAWTGRDEWTYLQALTDLVSPAERRDMRAGALLDWALESLTLARRAYAALPPGEGTEAQPLPLGHAYARALLPQVDRQLLRAGIRLGKLLDDSLLSRGSRVSAIELRQARACISKRER